MTGQLTAHCKLYKHLNNLGLIKKAICRFWKEKKETAEHIMCYCEGIGKIKYLFIGEENPSIIFFAIKSSSRLYNLIEKKILTKYCDCMEQIKIDQTHWSERQKRLCAESPE